MIYKLKSWLRDERGTAAIELAFIMPILALLMVGVADLTLAFNDKLVLEQAVQRSIERVMQTTTDATVEENIKEEVREGAGVTDDQIDVTYTLYCANAGTYVQTTWTATCPTGQVHVRYLQVSATDTYESMFPLHQLGLDKELTFTVEAGMRIE